jgi:hypothetical protein
MYDHVTLPGVLDNNLLIMASVFSRVNLGIKANKIWLRFVKSSWSIPTGGQRRNILYKVIDGVGLWVQLVMAWSSSPLHWGVNLQKMPQMVLIIYYCLYNTTMTLLTSQMPLHLLYAICPFINS